MAPNSSEGKRGGEQGEDDDALLLGFQSPLSKLPRTYFSVEEDQLRLGLSLRGFPFTAVQWQELQRQAIIYKHFVAAVPVPPELLLSAASIASPYFFPSSTCGGAADTSRFGNGDDPEPGRCRRTDGKKWRCSKDVAPGQKYCDRHVHRGRPRSRKPVELQKLKSVSAAASSNVQPSTVAPASCRSSPENTDTSLYSNTFSGVQPTRSAMNLPIYTMDQIKNTRCVGWGKGEGAGDQWGMALPQRNIGVRGGSGVVSFAEHYQEHLNPKYTNYSLLNTELSNYRAHQPRSFIDAWSTEVLPTVSSCDNSSISSFGKLPLSTLSLSMCGGGGIDEETQEAEGGRAGLPLFDGGAGKSRATTSWMAPGPLGEVLQSRSTVTSPRNSSSSRGSCGGGGLINIMSSGCYGSQEASPHESPTRPTASSSCVLHKALLSLSDSSCCTSPTFSPAPPPPPYRPEFGLQWVKQSK